MKLIYTFLLCLVLSAIGFSQSQTNPVITLENQLVEENQDITAVELITNHRVALKAVYDFRLDAINSYPESMSIEKKNKKFRKSSINNKEYQELKDKAKEAGQEKMEYLRPLLPPGSGKRKLNKNIKFKRSN